MKAKQNKETLHIFDIFSCSLIKSIHDHKKTYIAAKILGNSHFLLFFGGLSLNFDKEKWYYIVIEQFLKNDVFFNICHNFVTPISNLVI